MHPFFSYYCVYKRVSEIIDMNWESTFYSDDGYVNENHRNDAVIERLKDNYEYSYALQYLFLHSNCLYEFFKAIGNVHTEFETKKLEDILNHVLYDPEIIKLSFLEKLDFMLNLIDNQILNNLHNLNRDYPKSFNTVLFTYDKKLLSRGIISFVYIIRPSLDVISIHHNINLYFLAEEKLSVFSRMHRIYHLKRDLVGRFYF